MQPMPQPNAAIHFAPEGYTTGKGPKLMGRQAAGEGFLRAWMQHAGVPAFFCHTSRREFAEAFAALRPPERSSVPSRWVTPRDADGIAEAGTLYLPDPGLARAAFRRRRMGAAHRWSLCGITHTTASHNAMDAVADYLSGPVEPWDALICTSRVVLDSVKRLLAAEAEWLAARLRATAPPPPQLEVIPLGVDCAAHAENASARATWRGKIGAGAEDVVFLFVGRLAHHAKANPLPMYLALEQAARATRKRLYLVQAGWFANDGVRKEFAAGARAFCPSVNVVFLDGRDAAVRAGIRQAADVFMSLSDNVQETFGLTPVEAMAAGLACVVSDWDGYRETVRDGIDGWRVPTLAPPAGTGAVLAARHEDEEDGYDRYVGYSSLSISVDVTACAQACIALANDAGLRRRMGEAGRARAQQEFDWPVIVRRYQALWQSLADRRRSAAPVPALANPRRRDPFWLFAEYPTRVLEAGDRLAAMPEAAARLRPLLASGLVGFGGAVLPDEAAYARILERLAAAPGTSVAELVAGLPGAQRARLLRGLVWLHKVGLIRFA
jgi:glycosyltransferase involved in cell wall biosynthesis